MAPDGRGAVARGSESSLRGLERVVLEMIDGEEEKQRRIVRARIAVGLAVRGGEASGRKERGQPNSVGVR